MLYIQRLYFSLLCDVSKLSISLRVANSRNITHHESIVLDREKRPCDRGNDIRTYSKMDLDIWNYNQVREWFNKGAAPPDSYRHVPSETGYTIKID